MLNIKALLHPIIYYVLSFEFFQEKQFSVNYCQALGTSPQYLRLHQSLGTEICNPFLSHQFCLVQLKSSWLKSTSLQYCVARRSMISTLANRLALLLGHLLTSLITYTCRLNLIRVRQMSFNGPQ